ncbi:hypothetical protein WDU94_003427 [Cyamophila willieti]
MGLLQMIIAELLYKDIRNHVNDKRKIELDNECLVKEINEEKESIKQLAMSIADTQRELEGLKDEVANVDEDIAENGNILEHKACTIKHQQDIIGIITENSATVQQCYNLLREEFNIMVEKMKKMEYEYVLENNKFREQNATMESLDSVLEHNSMLLESLGDDITCLRKDIVADTRIVLHKEQEKERTERCIANSQQENNFMCLKIEKLKENIKDTEDNLAQLQKNMCQMEDANNILRSKILPLKNMLKNTRRCEFNDIQRCELNDIKRCEVNDIKICELNDIKRCELNDIKRCELNDIQRCELNDIKRCELNEIQRCELNDIKRCELNNIKRCELNEIQRCELNDIERCELNDIQSYESFVIKEKPLQLHKNLWEQWKYGDEPDMDVNNGNVKKHIDFTITGDESCVQLVPPFNRTTEMTGRVLNQLKQHIGDATTMQLSVEPIVMRNIAKYPPKMEPIHESKKTHDTSKEPTQMNEKCQLSSLERVQMSRKSQLPSTEPTQIRKKKDFPRKESPQTNRKNHAPNMESPHIQRKNNHSSKEPSEVIRKPHPPYTAAPKRSRKGQFYPKEQHEMGRKSQLPNTAPTQMTCRDWEASKCSKVVQTVSTANQTDDLFNEIDQWFTEFERRSHLNREKRDKKGQSNCSKGSKKGKMKILEIKLTRI